MAFPFAAVAMFAGSWLQSRSQSKALSAQLALRREEFELEKQTRAELAAEISKGGVVAAAAHEKRLEQINVSQAAAERRARGIGRRTGNVSGARGLAFQERREFEGARTQASLGFGFGEERRRLAVLRAKAGQDSRGTVSALADLAAQKGALKSSLIGDLTEGIGFLTKPTQTTTTTTAEKDLDVSVTPQQFNVARRNRELRRRRTALAF